MKILIAEDDPMLRTMAGTIMNHWGYDFDMASNGLEAVEKAQAHEGKYDLCLMDVDMPVMNGMEAAKIIRRRMDYFPIMAVTGNLGAKQDCLRVGMDDFLEKPYAVKRLFQKIQNLTVKTIKIDIRNNYTRLTKETPMNAQQTSVLKQLKEQNLSMISIFGTSTEATFIVNEVVPEYIEKEFAENQKPSVKFLDHNPEAKGMCRLFSKTSMVVKTFMMDEDFENENQQEKEKLKEITVSDG